MTYLHKTSVRIIAILCALALFTVGTASAASLFFGGASVGAGSVTLVSDLSDNPGVTSNDWSSVSFDDADGVLFSNLAILSTDYDVTDDDCFGGSPRFQIAVDTTGDSVSDGNIFVYIGPSPSFSGCTPGWQSSGNLIGNEEAGRWDYTQLGGPLGGYSGAPGSVLSGTIVGISLVVDSGWGFPDSEQTVLIDNVEIGIIQSTTYEFDFAPVTVTIIKYIDGAHASAGSAEGLSFPIDASWDADNIGAGAGSFTLSTVGFNNPNPYEATTALMSAGADYSASEDMSGPNVGEACADGKPFALQGYTTGASEAEAAAGVPSLPAPSLTNLIADAFIIVWNTDCTPHLTLEKVVMNDDSGAAVDTDWTLSAAGPTPISGVEGTPAVTNAEVAPGVYDLSEAGPLGYDASAWVCVGGTQTDDDTVVVAPGETVTCTITNDDSAVPPPPAPPATACTTPLVAPAGYTLQNGTPGSDTVTIAPFTMFVGQGGNDIVDGPAPGNYIVCTDRGNDTVTLGDGDFTISAGTGNNIVTTGNGNGFIATLQGSDKITTGNGVQTIEAGTGNNTVVTGDGDKTVTTGNANDNVTTGSGNDTINAGGGINTVDAGAGDDSVTTGSSIDNIDGGADTDTCSAGGGLNTVVNCEL